MSKDPTQEEQQYIAARNAMQEAITAFRTSPSVTAYLEKKRQVVESFMHERYPDIIYTINMCSQWNASVDAAHFDFGIDLVFENACASRLVAISHELYAYLAGLGNVTMIDQQKAEK